MKIRVDFTIEVAPENLPALRELAAAEDNLTAILFVKDEAQQHVVEYLKDNAVPVTISRNAVAT